MNPKAVRERLLDDEDLPKELRLNDGSRIVVTGRERWIVGPDFLAVLDHRRHFHHIAYRNIADICTVRRGRQRRAQ